MKYKLSILISILAFLPGLMAQEMQENQIYLADPTIFSNNGIYYLYGTKEDNKIPGEGFLVYTSSDLKKWEGPMGATDGFALKKGDAFGTKGFWAPQIFKYHHKFYMAYTANEHIAIACSENPLGPFKNDGKALEATVRQIDPFVFFDDDGKVYLYHVRLQNGNRIFAAEMKIDLSGIKPETLTECISGEKNSWENTVNSEWSVTEGPTVIKQDNQYIMLYSANDFRNPDYAVGFATSSSPLGPWKKSKSSPIISKNNLNINGTGHGDIFLDADGNMNYVLHTHFSENSVGPRKTAIIKLDFKSKKNKFEIEPNSFRYLYSTKN
jgi:beta-xylosidase